jgi:hypothetical protein
VAEWSRAIGRQKAHHFRLRAGCATRSPTRSPGDGNLYRPAAWRLDPEQRDLGAREAAGHGSNTPRYFPQNPCLQTDGTAWSCGPVFLGQPQDTGTFTVVAVLVGPAVDKTLVEAHGNANFGGFPELPAGILASYTVELVRR